MRRSSAENTSPVDAKPQPGHEGNTTPEQDNTAQELNRKLQANLSTDAGKHVVKMNGGLTCFLLRLLRARHWNTDEAVTLCEEILEYRAENGLDSIVNNVIGDQRLQDPANPQYQPEIKDDVVKKIQPTLPCGRHGYTILGQPLEIWRINQLRPADFLNSNSREDIFRWWHFHLESGLQAALDGAAHYKQQLRGTVLVFDLQGFGARHLHSSCIRLLVSLFGIGQSKYPESLSRLYILNAPTLFSGLWNAVKTVLNERTRKKIIMTNKPMHDDLLQLVERSVMPQFLGGSSPCVIGERISSSGASFTAIKVKARSEHRVPIQTNMGMFFGYEFFTDGGNDIKFGIFFFPPGKYTDGTAVESGEEILKLEKAGSSGQDTLTDCKDGTYVLVFDNKYSMMTGKDLRYSVETGGDPTVSPALSLDSPSGRFGGRAVGESVVTGIATPPTPSTPAGSGSKWK